MLANGAPRYYTEIKQVATQETRASDRPSGSPGGAQQGQQDLRLRADLIRKPESNKQIK